MTTAALLLALVLAAAPTLPGAPPLSGAPRAAVQGPLRRVVGEPLPPLLLPTLDDGHVLQLADLRGRPLLLIEFASW